MIKLFLLLAAIFLSFAIKAQIIVQGRVIDSLSHQPLEAASVAEENATNNKTITDRSGHFFLKTNSKEPSLIVSYIGYKILLGKPDTGELIFKLQSDALNLKDVTLQVVSSTMLRSISKIDLDLNPVRNTQELLRIVPGLFIAQHAV